MKAKPLELPVSGSLIIWKYYRKHNRDRQKGVLRIRKHTTDEIWCDQTHPSATSVIPPDLLNLLTLFEV